MLPAMVASASGRERFLREARAAAGIKHDHVVSIYQVGEDGGVPFLAMEFLEGEPLDKRLRREGQLPIADVLRIGRETALGLAAAHARGLIHRDIKPANLWLERQGGPEPSGSRVRVKILDFGLARPENEKALTQTGAIVGTPQYMAPEQVQNRDLDARCDLFSLGCVLYRLATGRLPFAGKDMISTLMAVATDEPPPPRELEPRIPPALAKLILRLLAKDREQRPHSAAQVAAELERIEHYERARPGLARARERLALSYAAWSGKRRPRWPWLAGAAGGLVALVLAGAVVLWPTPRGVVKIESDDPNVRIVFDRDGPTVEGAGGEPISLRAGEHGVHIKRGDFEFDAEKFVLKKGETITLKVELLAGKVKVTADGRALAEVALPARAPPAGAPDAATVGTPPKSSANSLPGQSAGRDAGPRVEPLPTTFTNGLGMEFVLVPKGKSWLGGGGGHPGSKEVVIAHDFYLGKYEVTQEEWQKLTGFTPSYWSRTGAGKDAVKDVPDAELMRFPVDNVSWDDAQAFLERLNKQQQVAGWVYRLPNEAEWEYACRGGPLPDKFESAYDFYFDKPTNQVLPEQANLGKVRKGNCRVGSYKPNRLGLYDMHGNVWEWCEDGETSAAGAPLRAYRGGCWFNESRLCRAAGHYAYPPTYRDGGFGLRMARVPVEKDAVASPPLDVAHEPTPPPATAADKGGKSPVAEKAPSARPVLPAKAAPADADRMAAEWVLSIGGTIKVHEAGQELEIKGADELSTGQFELTAVDLHENPQVTNAGLDHCKGCTNLRVLNLQRTKVTNAGLANFKLCKNLTHLDLTGVRVSDAGLIPFKDCKNLTELRFGETQISDAGLAHLNLTNVRVLLLWGDRVTDAGLAQLKDLRNLNCLSLFACHEVNGSGLAYLKDVVSLADLDLNGTQVTDAGLVHLKGLRNLRTLNVMCTPVTGAGLAHLKDLPQLQTLFLHGGKVCDAGLVNIEGLTSLVHLSLGDSEVSDDGLAHVKGLTNLDDLYLANSKVSDAGLIHLKGLTNLRRLELQRTRVSDAGLVHLSRMKRLTEVNLTGTDVTAEGVAKLKAALPGCKVIH
jgi:formylglycine-generating enzyme required for sulfatase activity/Leucine-rich repeat (LRR) protein